MEDITSNENLTSEFNQNAFIISRLHNDWMECKHHREKGMIKKYKDKLQSIQVELHCDTGKDERKELKTIDKQVLISLFREDYGIIFALLLQKELILKEVEHESGKGSTYKDMDEDDWD